MTSLQHNPTFKRRTILLGMVGTVAELAGCGGGGADVAGLSSGGTGSFTSGTISGLGSIIVNGIRYNDDNATLISRDDDSPFRGTLKVGMVVSIEGSSVTAATTTGGTATATASRISCGSEWKGPVSAINIGSSSFQILGMTVDVLTNTEFESEVTGRQATQLADLSPGDFVEVHGYVDRTNGHLQASRVEVVASDLSACKLSGVTTNFDNSAKSFKLQATPPLTSPITWGTDTSIPTGWSNDVFVRVTLDATTLHASKISLLTSALAQLGNGEGREAEIHGFITSYVSDSNFVVNGLTVDGTNARLSPGTLALSKRVEIHGTITNGILVATKIETPNNSDIESREFEFHGPVTAVSGSPLTFALRGITFKYDNTTNTHGISLAVGSRIEVKAIRSASGWFATDISADA